MKRRNVMVGLGLVAAVAVVSTAVAGVDDGPKAGVSAKKGKRGPRGPAGPAGPQGAQGPQGPPGQAGANGTAKVIVHWGDSDGGQASVVLDGPNTTPGVTVKRCQTNGGGTAGEYLIDIPASLLPVRNITVTPDASASSNPGVGHIAIASISGGIGGCSGGDVLVQIELHDGTNKASGAFVAIN